MEKGGFSFKLKPISKQSIFQKSVKAEQIVKTATQAYLSVAEDDPLDVFMQSISADVVHQEQF